MQGGFNYYEERTAAGVQKIGLRGNAFVWLGGTAAVLMTVLGLGWEVIRKRGIRAILNRRRIEVVLLAGYFASLLPFALVLRSTFIYHYLPALLFAICLLAYRLGELEQFGRLATMSRRGWLVCGFIFLLALYGFLASLPYVYGLPLPA